jgi:glycosyltransferase involved in cell wall biosynthesis
MPPTLASVDRPGDVYDVATIGSWTWDANAAGLRWFVDQVVPLLAAGTRVGVAGAGAAEITAGNPNVTYEGRVPDARQFLAKGRVVVVPSVAGAGVQIKSVDAIGTGLPVVGTSLAMRGIDTPPATVQIADEPEGFAQALREQLSSPPDQSDREDAEAWARERRETFTRRMDDALISLSGKPVAA